MAARSRTKLDVALQRWQRWAAESADIAEGSAGPDGSDGSDGGRRARAWGAASAVARAAADRDDAPDALAAHFGAGSPASSVPAEAVEATLAAVPARRDVPAVIGQVYEATLTRTDRRRSGVFYTPAEVARGLVAIALADPEGRGGELGAAEAGGGLGVVLDPAAGTGAFLLAAVEHLHERSAGSGASCVAAVRGCDIDERAVRVAEGALAWWAWLQDGIVAWPQAGALRCADGLAGAEFGGPSPGAARVVVGNPPFLNQLGSHTVRSEATRRALQARFGEAAKGYVDTAALFLLAALEAVEPGGTVVLVQPESTLVATHSAAVRARVCAEAVFDGLWVGGAGIFAAGVRVCAPILRKRATTQFGGTFSKSVGLWTGTSVAPSERIDIDSPERRVSLFGGEWAPLLARSRGVPDVTLRSGGTVGDLATATAGFRDQFYGLVPYVVEHPGPIEADAADGHGPPRRWAPLVTSGLVGGDGVRWGARAARFAGRRWERPVVDLLGLERGDPTLHRWVRSRLRPKLLLATQTNVLQACVDPEGVFVPSVPVISVEPLGASQPLDDVEGGAEVGDLWLVAAVLAAPVTSAHAASQFAGAGLSAGSLRLSARQVRALPTPRDVVAWREAARTLRDAVETATKPSTNADRTAPSGWHNGARTMAAAYGLDAQRCDQVERWWREAAGRHAPAMFL